MRDKAIRQLRGQCTLGDDVIEGAVQGQMQFVNDGAGFSLQLGVPQAGQDVLVARVYLRDVGANALAVTTRGCLAGVEEQVGHAATGGDDKHVRARAGQGDARRLADASRISDRCATELHYQHGVLLTRFP